MSFQQSLPAPGIGPFDVCGRPEIARGRGACVSIVVPTHNRAELLKALLASLACLEWDEGRLELFVVGDTSITDETEAVVSAFAQTAPFPVTYLTAPNSPAAKRNAGIRASRGEWVAFTDDDCRVDPRWLRAACARFGEPDVAGVQGQTCVPEAPGNPASYRRTRRLTEPNFQTCNILYRRDALVRIGGFDERFATVSEDSDVAFSVLEGGGRIEYAPDAVVYHPPREDSAWDVLRASRNNLYAPLLHQKHPKLYRARLGSPLPRTTRAYLALDALAALALVLGQPWLAGMAAACHGAVFAAQAACHCRGDRSGRRALTTAWCLLIAPYLNIYYLAVGNRRFGGRLWW
jgi:GT2 family glycosyltransferase